MQGPRRGFWTRACPAARIRASRWYFHATHWPEPDLQPMAGIDGIIHVSLGLMHRRGSALQGLADKPGRDRW